MIRARAESYRIPWGNLGVRTTIRHMRRLVQEALRDPLVLEAGANLSGWSDSAREKIGVLEGWLADRVQYTPDPEGQELIRSPAYMVLDIRQNGSTFGDCDDVATLAAAVGKAAGIPARFVLLSFNRNEPFSHVYTELENTDSLECQWIPLDTTAPAQFGPGLRVWNTERHAV